MVTPRQLTTVQHAIIKESVDVLRRNAKNDCRFGGRGLHIALAANSVRDPLSARGEPRLCSDKYVLIRQKMLEHGDDF